MIDNLKQILSLGTIPVVLLLGIYLSSQLKWLQFTKFFLGLRYAFGKQQASDQQIFSSFAALAAVLGGNLGTGNIAGIAVALTTGGPGALFWMWLMAAFGAIVKFTGCYLGVKYRVPGITSKTWIGGPMYYLAKGLKSKKLALLFSLFTLCSAFTVGNLVQVNSLAVPLQQHTHISPVLSGIVMALFVGIVLVGGQRSFAAIAAKLVPFMAIIYLTCCLVIIGMFYQQILPALKLIFQAALAPNSLLGGVLGYSIFDAIKVGFDRGLFATDAGVGLAPILHSQVDSNTSIKENAFIQGMVSVTAPIIVMVICMLTGLVLLVTNTWQDPCIQSTNICIKAFQLGLGNKASYIVIITLWLFAFTTILTWAHCAEHALIFISKNESVRFCFRWLFVLTIPLGTYLSVNFVWSLADIALNCMLIINSIGVALLAKQIIPPVRDKLSALTQS